jgi:hypothetical protein
MTTFMLTRRDGSAREGHLDFRSVVSRALRTGTDSSKHSDLLCAVATPIDAITKSGSPIVVSTGSRLSDAVSRTRVARGTPQALRVAQAFPPDRARRGRCTDSSDDRAYGMRGTPTTILIDAKGEIRTHHFGAHDDLLLGAELQQLLMEAEDLS